MAGKKQPKAGVMLDHKGATFTVWAPNAKQVFVAAPYISYDTSNKIALDPLENGYWSVHLKDVEPGLIYKYLIDTGGDELLVRNDPQARVLTSSENGDSVIADNDFAWQDTNFKLPPKNQQVIYELHIGTFNRKDSSTQGTFYDAIEKLDYLKEIGINVIELMPVCSMSASNGWGYNTVHLFSVENAYGGRRGLMEFVNAAHTKGIGVILDVVYNHFPSINEFTNFDQITEHGGIYFYPDNRAETPWGIRPNFSNLEVREFFLDNIVMWLNEFHLDGFRFDSTSYMRNIEGGSDPDKDLPEVWSFLQEANQLIHKINPEAISVAEDVGFNDAITRPIPEGGAGFDAQWWLNYAHSLRQEMSLPTQFPTDYLHELTGVFNGQALQRIIFSDSHDTAANGHVRINEAASPGNAVSVEARYNTLLASCASLTAPGIPMLLQGQEFMQQGAFNDWKELEWDKTERFNGIVLAHKHLIDLRKNTFKITAGLAGDNIEIIHSNLNDHVYVYRRWQHGGHGDDTLVIMNFSNNDFNDYQINLPEHISGEWRVRFNSSWHGYSLDFKQNPIEKFHVHNHQANISLSRYNCLILSQD